MNERFGQLKQLIGGYFHQDWDIEGGTDNEVVWAYKRAITPEQLVKTINELDELIKDCSNPSNDPDQLLNGLGCEYCYQSDGLTALKWIRRIRRLLHSESSSPPTS